MNRGGGRWRFGLGGIVGAHRSMRLKKLVDQAIARDDDRATVALYEESLALCREREDWNGVLRARFGLGMAALKAQNYRVARSHYEQCVSLARRLQSPSSLASALLALGQVVSYQGEFDLAEKLGREALELWCKQDSAQGIAGAYCLLGAVAADADTARAHFEDALGLVRPLDNARSLISVLVSLGHAAAPDRDNTRERIALEECRELCEAYGDLRSLSYTLNNLGHIERYAGNLTEAASLYRESLKLKEPLGDRWAIAYTLEGCAALAVQRKQGERAAMLFGAASGIRESLGAPLERKRRAVYEADVQAARALLSPDLFDAAWNRGRSLSTAQAVQIALSGPGPSED